MNLDVPVVPRDTFIGSSSARFANQAATDIHFANFWLGRNRSHHRIYTGCSVWGVDVSVVQRTYIGQRRYQKQPYHRFPLGQYWLVINDEGLPAEHPAHVLGNTDQLIDPDANMVEIGGVPSPGRRTVWNHKYRVSITPVLGLGAGQELFLYYHRHKARTNHGPNPPLIIMRGQRLHKTRRGRSMKLGPQVQSFRMLCVN